MLLEQMPVRGRAGGALLLALCVSQTTAWGTPLRVRALTALTLAAGLASTIFAPVASTLAGALGWRAGFLVLAGILAAIVVPLNAVFLPKSWPTSDVVRPHPADRLGVRGIVQSRPFLLLQAGLTLVALGLYAATLNLVPILTSRGYSSAFAALVFGLVGIGQVAGRLLFLSGRLTARPTLTVTVMAASAAVVLALLAIVAGPPAVLIVVALQAGAVRGSLTLIQAAAVAERWGTARLGLLNGIFTAPITAATALAPTAGIGLAIVTGSYPVALLVAAAGCALGTIAVAASGSPAATGGSDFQYI
jgi:predicted MFS family arabinose efflux permease